MATEKISTSNGVDIFRHDDSIIFFSLDIESPIISPQISIPINEWDEVKNYIDNKIKENASK